MNFNEFLSSFTINDLITLFTFFFVQISLAAFFSLKLFDKPFTLLDIFVKAFTFSAVVLLVRKFYDFYQIKMGTHSLVLGALFAAFLILTLNFNIFEGIVSSLICFTSFYLSAPITLWVINIFNLTEPQIMNSYLLYSLVANFENFFLVIFIVIIVMTKFNLYKLVDKD